MEVSHSVLFPQNDNHSIQDVFPFPASVFPVKSTPTVKKVIESIPGVDFYEMVEKHSRLRSMIFGYIAEHHLEEHLHKTGLFDVVEKFPDKGRQRGDFKLVRKGSTTPKILELKCLKSAGGIDLLNSGYYSRIKLGPSDGITLEGGEKVTSFEKTAIDILAVCTINLNSRWDFYFINTRYLNSDTKHKNRIHPAITINTHNTPCMYPDIKRVLKDFD